MKLLLLHQNSMNHLLDIENPMSLHGDIDLVTIIDIILMMITKHLVAFQ